MTEVALKLRIYGRVQGVCYRDWMVKVAQARGIDGWVRNRADGSVEALVVGEESQLREMIGQCHKGPLLARVDRIDEEPAQGITPRGEFVRKPTV